MTALLDLRLALQANGYAPIPCQGKIPTLAGWQRMPRRAPKRWHVGRGLTPASSPPI